MDITDDELVLSLPTDEHAANGIPPAPERARRRRAFELVEHLLEGAGVHGSLRVSPLGPEWSGDIDAHLDGPVPAAALRQAGWLNLRDLLGRVGVVGAERWAVIEDGEVIAAVDFTSEPVPDSVRAVLQRCAERGEVRVREVLELRALARAGKELPNDAIVHVAAGIEAALGGSQLRAWYRSPVGAPPARVPRRMRARLGAVRSRYRPRVIVALSGVDGSGKSSLRSSLAAQLTRAGVPNGVVWARPGMGPRWIGSLAALGKRVVKQDSSPGVRAVASGAAETLPSRKGALGWVWTTIITFSFLHDVRAQLRRAYGVVLFDRHLLDALATLEFVYGGVDLRFARFLVKRFLPGAALIVYLDVPADVAVSRKPGDTFGMYAVQEQLSAYGDELQNGRDVTVVDACRPSGDIAFEILHQLVHVSP